MPTTVATPADIRNLQDQITALKNADAARTTAISQVMAELVVLRGRVAVLEGATPPPPPPGPVDPPPPPPVDPPSPTGALPDGVTLRQIDGGPAYNAKFSPGWPSTPDFYPIAVWYESTDEASQVAFDKATGLNTYVALTSHSRLDLIKAGGMYAIPWGDGGTGMANVGTETVGWVVEDEPDMQPGWWGAPTAEQFAAQDRRVAALPKDGRARYTNFGLGILSADDGSAAAKRFVQQYQDYVSADYYFYSAPAYEASRAIGKGEQRLTDDEARRARNYGIVVERIRAFADYKKPTWGFVEVGGPHAGYNNSADSYIKPDQLRAAMWHCIIAGARGLIFFNHSFAGPAQTQHALRDSYYAPQRAMVQSVTAQIRELAPVLNGLDAVGLVSATGVATLAKWNDGRPVILAGNSDNAAKSVTFTVKGRTPGTVTVLGENRTLPMADGTFTDTFADGTAVHIYRL